MTELTPEAKAKLEIGRLINDFSSKVAMAGISKEKVPDIIEITEQVYAKAQLKSQDDYWVCPQCGWETKKEYIGGIYQHLHQKSHLAKAHKPDSVEPVYSLTEEGRAEICKELAYNPSAGCPELYKACQMAYDWYYRGGEGDYRIIGDTLKRALEAYNNGVDSLVTDEKLMEKIAKHLWETDFPEGNTWEQLKGDNSPSVGKYLDKAAQLLALYPEPVSDEEWVEEIAQIIYGDWAIGSVPWKATLQREKTPWLKTAHQLVTLIDNGIANAKAAGAKEENKSICEFLILSKANLLDVNKIADGSYKVALEGGD